MEGMHPEGHVREEMLNAGEGSGGKGCILEDASMERCRLQQGRRGCILEDTSKERC
jgi:hypothetical protein